MAFAARPGTPPLDPATIARVGAALVACTAGIDGRRRARADRPRHARVGRVDRGGARPRADRRGRRRWSAPASCRRRPSPYRPRPRASTPASSSRPRTTPTETTASRCSRAPARSSTRRSRATSRRWSPTRRGRCAATPSADVERGPTISSTHYLAHLRLVLPDAGPLARLAHRRRLRQRRHQRTWRRRCFAALGFDVDVIGADPDGRNINLGCGSTHLEALQARVPASGGPARRGVRRRRRPRAVRRSPRPPSSTATR